MRIKIFGIGKRDERKCLGDFFSRLLGSIKHCGEVFLDRQPREKTRLLKDNGEL